MCNKALLMLLCSSLVQVLSSNLMRVPLCSFSCQCGPSRTILSMLYLHRFLYNFQERPLGPPQCVIICVSKSNNVGSCTCTPLSLIGVRVR
jgi:hypothetical protein